MSKCEICNKVTLNNKKRFCCNECSVCSQIMKKTDNIRCYLLNIRYYLNKYDSKEALKRYRYSRQLTTFLNNIDIPKIVDYDEYREILENIEKMKINISKVKSIMIPNKIEKWLYLGFSNKSAKKISDIYSTSLNSFIFRYGSKQGYKKYNSWVRKSQRNHGDYISYFSLEYWINKGYSLHDAKEETRKVNSRDLNFFINKYGKDEGNKKYNNMLQKRSESLSKSNYINNHSAHQYYELNNKKAINLEKFIIKYGEKEGKIKYNNFLKKRLRQNLRSGPSIIFQNKLINDFKENNIDLTIKDEVLINGKLFDFLINDKIVIEINGDWWHMNPLIYNEDYFNKLLQTKAKNIWDYDLNKIKLCNQTGYFVIVVWESFINKFNNSYFDIFNELILNDLKFDNISLNFKNNEVLKQKI